MKTMLLVATLFALLLAQPAAATEHIVNQKGKSFVQKKVTVRVGDRVKFMNDDPFSHNVFSLSDSKSFDLGSYGQGQGKSVVMDVLGTVDVECAVHPDMKMTVEVIR